MISSSLPVDGLRVEGLTIVRHHRTILTEASFSVQPGVVTVLLGKGGAGTSTLLDGIAGIIPVASGKIFLNTHRIDRLAPYRRARAGLGYVPQGRQVFSRLTLRQNLLLAKSAPDALEAVFEVFPQLAKRQNLPAGLLSGGETQMLAIACALLNKPTVLLIDHFSDGLAPKVVDALFSVIVQLAESGTAVLLVEQLAVAVLQSNTRVYLLESGKIRWARWGSNPRPTD